MRFHYLLDEQFIKLFESRDLVGLDDSGLNCLGEDIKCLRVESSLEVSQGLAALAGSVN